MEVGVVRRELQDSASERAQSRRQWRTRCTAQIRKRPVYPVGLVSLLVDQRAKPPRQVVEAGLVTCLRLTLGLPPTQQGSLEREGRGLGAKTDELGPPAASEYTTSLGKPHSTALGMSCGSRITSSSGCAARATTVLRYGSETYATIILVVPRESKSSPQLKRYHIEYCTARQCRGATCPTAYGSGTGASPDQS